MHSLWSSFKRRLISDFGRRGVINAFMVAVLVAKASSTKGQILQVTRLATHANGSEQLKKEVLNVTHTCTLIPGMYIPCTFSLD